MRAWLGRSVVGRAYRGLRLAAWRWALRHLCPDRGDHTQLVAECRRMQASGPTVWKGALGVPYQLERRLLAEMQ